MQSAAAKPGAAATKHTLADFPVLQDMEEAQQWYREHAEALVLQLVTAFGPNMEKLISSDDFAAHMAYAGRADLVPTAKAMFRTKLLRSKAERALDKASLQEAILMLRFGFTPSKSSYSWTRLPATDSRASSRLTSLAPSQVASRLPSRVTSAGSSRPRPPRLSVTESTTASLQALRQPALREGVILTSPYLGVARNNFPSYSGHYQYSSLALASSSSVPVLVGKGNPTPYHIKSRPPKPVLWDFEAAFDEQGQAPPKPPAALDVSFAAEISRPRTAPARPASAAPVVSRSLGRSASAARAASTAKAARQPASVAKPAWTAKPAAAPSKGASTSKPAAATARGRKRSEPVLAQSVSKVAPPTNPAAGEEAAASKVQVKATMLGDRACAVVQIKACVDTPSASQLTAKQTPVSQDAEPATSPFRMGVGEVAKVKLKVRENLLRIRQAEEAKVRDINERVQRDAQLVAKKKASVEQAKKDKAKAELDAINAKVAEKARVNAMQEAERTADE